VLAALDGLVGSLGRRGRADLCCAYVRGTPWVSQLLIGIRSSVQLQVRRTKNTVGRNFLLGHSPKVSRSSRRLYRGSVSGTVPIRPTPHAVQELVELFLQTAPLTAAEMVRGSCTRRYRSA
jgi:hypothetical protein